MKPDRTEAGLELIRFASADALVRAVAERWFEQIRPERPQGVALSGGRIARAFFSAVAARAKADPGLLGSIHFFWADERCVPPDHPDSNFGLAEAHLLRPLAIPPGRIHRVRGEIDPEAAVAETDAELRRFLETRASGLDWVFLGMGEDGHVASLFPGNPEAAGRIGSFYLSVVGPKPPRRRITLSYGAIAAAREVWVLVSAIGKERALEDSLAPGERTPLGKVIGSRRSTLIFSDLPVRMPSARKH
jgi:6-phosphogluconolactonase